MTAMGFDFARARTNMVENQVRTNDVTDLAVQDAMKDVARERFCPPGRGHLAYAEAPIEYAPGWFLMEPRDVSKLLQALAPRPGERVMAIAAPYAAAVLARIGCRVTARVAYHAAEAVFEALSDEGVAVEEADLSAPGSDGPYDLMVCEGGLSAIPQAWIDALALGGRLAAVERRGPGGKAQLLTRGEDGLVARRELFDSTPRMAPGFAPKAAFTF